MINSERRLQQLAEMLQADLPPVVFNWIEDNFEILHELYLHVDREIGLYHGITFVIFCQGMYLFHTEA